ncbi:hypothetical protein UCREL1_6594 [Eutypa lata UCREL1]|uniref:Uncharacterized protein n=1 Tax=Eutypa lata (strain UCR-EL1) TaxID=1287681 RepID=M7SPM7_EUTLA|nr:hypothetical protein UCREL1_6594 [Eutypa lata UCREL1]
MSRHFTIATGATALLALAGRGVAFSSREGVILAGPTPTPTSTPTPATASTTITAAPKFSLLHAHIKAATEPTILAGPANLIKEKAKAKGEDAEDGEEDEGDDGDDGEDDVEKAETGVCRTANKLVNYCADAIPNIESAPEDQIAQCLCCDGDGGFEPDYFDDAAASCAGWIKTAVPESTGAYKAWSTLATLCGSGNGGLDSSASTSGGAFITSAAVVPEACDTLGTIGGYCKEETTGFDELPLSSQAECLCYMSTADGASSTVTASWVPDYFDDAYSSCAGSTDTLSLDPGYVNLCSGFGDFLAASVSATTTAESSSSVSAASLSSTTGQGDASETASSAATAVSATTTPSAEPDTGAAAGLSLPSSWPVAIGAVLGAAILLL